MTWLHFRGRQFTTFNWRLRDVFNRTRRRTFSGGKHETTSMDFYSQIYGERWQQSLYSAMSDLPFRHVARMNRFVEEIIREQMDGGKWLIPIDVCLKENLPICYIKPYYDPGAARERAFAPPESLLHTGGVLPYYLMDLASIFVALLLDVQPQHTAIADFCAAPGGKSLVLAESLQQQLSAEKKSPHHIPPRLICNDKSMSRKQRLRRTLDSYIPSSLPVADRNFTLEITSHDASRWHLYEPQTYDRILLDAPCSHERHYLHASSSLKLKWPSLRRSKKITAAQQRRLLCSSLRCLKRPGRIVYSTCALSPYENDDVIEHVLQESNNNQPSLIQTEEEFGEPALKFLKHLRQQERAQEELVLEKTTYGWSILPDKSLGWGPMYFSILEWR